MSREETYMRAERMLWSNAAAWPMMMKPSTDTPRTPSSGQRSSLLILMATRRSSSSTKWFIADPAAKPEKEGAEEHTHREIHDSSPSISCWRPLNGPQGISISIIEAAASLPPTRRQHLGQVWSRNGPRNMAKGGRLGEHWEKILLEFLKLKEVLRL